MDNPGLIKDTDVAGLAGVSPQMCQFSFMGDAAATCLAARDGVWPAIDSASPVPSLSVAARVQPALRSADNASAAIAQLAGQLLGRP